MTQEKLKELLADLYKKRDQISREIDSIAADASKRQSKRYTKLINNLDTLTKRIIDLDARMDDGNEHSDVERMRNLFDLVKYAHKYMEDEESRRNSSNKKQLMTFKGAPTEKIIGIYSQQRFAPFSFQDAEMDLERILKRRKRRLLRKRNVKGARKEI